MERVFKALADGTRRDLLDQLFAQDGLSLTELCEGQSASRQAISKHLTLLEQAGLIQVHWVGREKRHYLNPVPIQIIADRWIHKYRARQAAAVADLKRSLEKPGQEDES